MTSGLEHDSNVQVHTVHRGTVHGEVYCAGRVMYMIDFVGKEIHIGDSVVYLKNVRTGSSTIRKCMFRGIVSGETNCKIKIHPLDYNKPPYETIYPEDVVVINT